MCLWLLAKSLRVSSNSISQHLKKYSNSWATTIIISSLLNILFKGTIYGFPNLLPHKTLHACLEHEQSFKKQGQRM